MVMLLVLIVAGTMAVIVIVFVILITIVIVVIEITIRTLPGSHAKSGPMGVCFAPTKTAPNSVFGGEITKCGSLGRGRIYIYIYT